MKKPLTRKLSTIKKRNQRIKLKKPSKMLPIPLLMKPRRPTIRLRRLILKQRLMRSRNHQKVLRMPPRMELLRLKRHKLRSKPELKVLLRALLRELLKVLLSSSVLHQRKETKEEKKMLPQPKNE